MALFNYATRELSAKIVYYGPGLSGKTTNIEMVHHLLRPEQKGRLISLPTETDRTLFFDFLPLDLGQIKGFRVRFHLYTVPGQVFYNATRRLVLQGVDGVVFVADSQVDMMNSNIESLKNLTDNLATYGKKLHELPFVMQYNKRDLRNISSVADLNARLNALNVQVYEGIAKDGAGVTETLVGISRKVFASLRKTLLLPGDAAESDEIGTLGDTTIRRKFAAQEAEGLEEISEIEEIPEPPPIVPDVDDMRRPGHGLEFPISIDLDVPAPGPAEAPPAVKIPYEPPPAAKVPPPAAKPAYEPPPVVKPPPEAEPYEPPPAAAPPPWAKPAYEPPPAAEAYEPHPAAQADEEMSGPLFEGLDEIEIEIPERVDEPTPAPAPRAGISVETEGSGLTFLKFEDAFISPEGHAVLPAVFLDAEGNPVRIRIRVSMDEGR